jgi:hypothetical protein
MNAETARHLNTLLRRAVPFALKEDHRDFIFVESPNNHRIYLTSEIEEIAADLATRAHQIVLSHYPAALAQAISEAASARLPLVTFEAQNFYWWLPNGNVGGRIAVDMSLPEITAMVEADNQQRAAEYERYRLACEQGVAVPPTE